jgi:hypothetical protein
MNLSQQTEMAGAAGCPETRVVHPRTVRLQCRRTGKLIVFAVVLLGLANLPLAASQITGLSVTANAGNYQLTQYNSSTTANVPATYINGSDSASAEVLSSPAQDVTESVMGSGIAGANALGVYYFEVTGPRNVSVPVDITGNLTTSMDAYDEGQANATLAIYFGGAQQAIWSANSGSCSPCNSSIYVNQTLSVPANSQIEVYGSASIFTNKTYLGGLAITDPYIQIDPSFSTPGYSLVLSPEVANLPVPTSPTPEPSSFALGAIGFVALLTCLRRQ